MEKQCEFCNEVFVTDYPRDRYCGITCRQGARGKRLVKNWVNEKILTVEEMRNRNKKAIRSQIGQEFNFLTLRAKTVRG